MGYQLVINYYSGGVSGHTNISFINNGNHEGTYGANMANWLTLEGGVYQENSYYGTATSTQTIPVSASDYANVLSAAQARVGEGVWHPFGSTCVDFIDDMLDVLGTPYNAVHYLPYGTIVGTYAFLTDQLTRGWGDIEVWLMDPNYGPGFSWFNDFWDIITDFFGGVSKIADEVAVKEQYAIDCTYYSPIAIDLNGDGIQTTNLTQSDVNFDLDGDGFAQNTGWLSSDDGFIAVDLNGDGKINNGTELFGSNQVGDGFAKLALFDSDANGVVNANDNNFVDLLVWRDANGNGVTDDGELGSLSDYGVTSLSIQYTSWNQYNQGNLIIEHSEAMIEGNQVQLSDVYFRQFDVAA